MKLSLTSRLPIRIILASQIRSDVSTLQPSLDPAIQHIFLWTMCIQIHLRRLADLVLRPSQILVPAWVLLDLIFRDTVDLLRVHWRELVLVKQQCVEDNPPSVSSLLDEEEEPTVSVVIHFDVVKGEAASDCDFHLAHCTREVRVHIDLRANDAMQDIHELGAFLKSSFRGFDELVNAALLPTCSDVRIVKEH